ncbi:uncharacterized protein METZ01_LOCUS251148 [marine metagenome]|uniref:Uncharacterized protein n=1 Tax=marine metagenome TaxID=408172 RepID=A0A382IF10_9ZZZZ
MRMFGRIIEWFKDQYGGSREHLSRYEQIQRQFAEGSGWRNNKFVLYILILVASSLVCFGGFLAFEKGIFFLGAIVSGVLLVLGIVGKYFHSEVLDEHSYKDDHNPHIREMKDKLRERK